MNFKIESIEYIYEELKKDSGKNLIIISSKNKDKIFWKLILRNVLLENIKGFHKIGYIWNGWDCTIDSDNGKIKNKRFTK
ncbi:MAG: hypothetical protein FWC41_10810 [Firmicutes bacterium]|nr:hypothetical protein [Bacillota bacterium]